MKLSELKNALEIDSSLVGSVVRACGGWAEFKEIAQDVADYGCSGGIVGGLIYYTDTVAFTKRNLPAIKRLLASRWHEQGYNSVAHMVSKFSGLDESLESVEYLLLTGRGDPDIKEQVYNVLAWYVCEYVAYEYVSLREQENY